jgi:hypothetical protein
MTDPTYTDADFANPVARCDIVMKGGITSGVVYPLALTELARHYRFTNIGGTSAGAIAAAAAAAAEYGRHVPGKGFMRLAVLPTEAGQVLFSLFQPTRTVKPLFDILVSALSGKSVPGKVAGILAAAIGGFRWLALFGALIGIVAGALVGALVSRPTEPGFIAFAILCGLIGLFAGVVFGLFRAATKSLPANDYGMCSGLQQPGYDGKGFTDWLADLIDETAGRDPKQDDPLTFGDLASPPGGRPAIVLQMMTTNLMQRRPYTLPMENRLYSFRREDFEKLFPKRIMDYLLRDAEKVDAVAEDPGEFYRVPQADRLPLIVAARMSLSFPVLICAVPLYACDYTLQGEQKKVLRRSLFSDGGLSSNFPIHFFDHLLPNTPTFGISLDEYDPRRDKAMNNVAPGAAPAKVPPETRVWMPDPTDSQGGLLIPIQPFKGLPAFLARLIDAAKDWQDNLQSTLAGSRDRIVHVFLKPKEGGLNIVMPPELVQQLGGYGKLAGDQLLGKFDLDEHRWRRFLVAMDGLDRSLDKLAESFDDQHKADAPEAFSKFLDRYASDAKSYKQLPGDLQLLRQRVATLADLGRTWRGPPKIPETKLPHPITNLRITPKT